MMLHSDGVSTLWDCLTNKRLGSLRVPEVSSDKMEQRIPVTFVVIAVSGLSGNNFLGKAKLTSLCWFPVLHWGLTPQNKRNDPSYHPVPAFLHTILSKHRKNLDPSKLWSHVRKPRLDGISEPSLTRTLYEFTGDCFAITLKGPDGLLTSPNSFRDGQGLLTLPLAEVFGEQGEDHKMYQALMEIAPKFVAMA